MMCYTYSRNTKNKKERRRGYSIAKFSCLFIISFHYVALPFFCLVFKFPKSYRQLMTYISTTLSLNSILINGYFISFTQIREDIHHINVFFCFADYVFRHFHYRFPSCFLFGAILKASHSKIEILDLFPFTFHIQSSFHYNSFPLSHLR